MENYVNDYVNFCVKDEVLRRTQHTCYVPRELSVRKYKNAVIYPFCGERRGEVVSSEGIALSTDFPHTVSISDYPKEGVILKRKKAVVIGVFSVLGWGHCFTDHFNKLWYFTTDEFKKLQQNNNVDIVVVTITGKIPGYMYTLFEYAGFDLHQAKIVTEPTEYEEVLIPDNCYYQIDDGWYRYYTDEYVSLLENMKARARSEATSHGNFIAPERIYITRTQGAFSSAYRDVGEEVIEKEFRKLGYTIIAPEKHSVAEQIWMMMNVKDIVAADGSGCHATTFCNPGTKLTILMKADFLVMHQVTANQIAKANVTYVSVHHSIFVSKTAPWHGPFFLCITKNLERYVGHKIPHIPYFLRISFMMYCIRELYTRTLRKSNFMDQLVRKTFGFKIS